MVIKNVPPVPAMISTDLVVLSQCLMLTLYLCVVCVRARTHTLMRTEYRAFVCLANALPLDCIPVPCPCFHSINNLMMCWAVESDPDS